jgi:hydrogenase large subunit
MRFSAAESQALVGHYLEALVVRRQAHEMGAILAGKLPHTVAYEFGGVTVRPDAAMIKRFRTYLDAVTAFIDGAYWADVEALAARYPDYYDIGRGYGNLLAFGVFDLDASGATKLLARGRWADAVRSVETVDTAAITEQARYSWYSPGSGGLNPGAGITEPSPDKAEAYSWLKAPRYNGTPYEVGALARMWVNGDYRHGVSVMDRHAARMLEASKIAHAMYGWLDQLNLSAPAFSATPVPTSGAGIGLTEAPRGALGHWLGISNRAVSRYQVLTPTCWNCSPRDGAGVAGPLEEALAGAPISDATQPVEVLRVVQSFDPCLSCAVH